MDEITIKEVVTRKDLRNFIHLPARIHKDDSCWLPPIYMDEWALFDKRKNRSFRYTDTVLYIAFRRHLPVGRIMGIINKRYNAINNEHHGRFCFMECINDKEVAHLLITHIEDWAREKGMIKLVGPLGFSDKDPQGFQIEGFEYPLFITGPTNAPYMPHLIEGEGYTKKRDLVNYLVKMPHDIPQFYKRVLDRMAGVTEHRIIEFRSKKEMKPYIIPVLELMNDTFREIYGFVPLDDNEKKDIAARYLPILDPQFIKIVETNGQLTGFVIGIPDLSPGIKAAKGRILPFGFLKILRESRRSKKLLMLLGGIQKGFRGKGIDVIMGVKILQTAINKKMELIDSHLVLENNDRMRGEYERIGGKVAKRFRIFQKDL